MPAPLTTYECKSCGKPRTPYARPSSGRVEWKCLPCNNEKMKALYHGSADRRKSVAEARKRRRAIPEKKELETNQFRENHLRRKFGISAEAYGQMLEAQLGRCAVCGTSEPGGRGGKYFAVDHCHETKALRGLLCFDCNTGIGKLGDNVDGLMRAVRYLQQHEIA